MRCRKRTEWGQCAQEVNHDDDFFCAAHRQLQTSGRPVDRYWHEKLVKGLIVSTVEWMSASELNAIINGRYRGDGRRIDQFVTGDPLLIDVEALTKAVQS